LFDRECEPHGGSADRRGLLHVGSSASACARSADSTKRHSARDNGEETDFCSAPSARLGATLLAADVFVFHAGEVSFSKTATGE